MADKVKVPAANLSLTKNSESFFTVEQLKKIRHHTPSRMIKKREGSNKQIWKYVSVGDTIKVLNTMFGGFWNFEIITDEATALDIAMKTKCVSVRGRLSVYNPEKGITIVREQYGRKPLTIKKGGKELVDFGNDMKGAGADALKKCASQFGLFSDIYSQDDFFEIDVVDDGSDVNSEKVKSIIEAAKAKVNESNQ